MGPWKREVKAPECNSARIGLVLGDSVSILLTVERFCERTKRTVDSSASGLTPHDALELAGKLCEWAGPLVGEPHASHSQTLTTGGDGVTAVPLIPVVYTLDQFQEAIESLRKDGA